MKKLVFAFFALALFGCKHDPISSSACIQEKTEAFKKQVGAREIVRIDGPQGIFIHFLNACADCGDPVFDLECNIVCMTNVDGWEPSFGLVNCPSEVFGNTRKTIWKAE